MIRSSGGGEDENLSNGAPPCTIWPLGGSEGALLSGGLAEVRSASYSTDFERPEEDDSRINLLSLSINDNTPYIHSISNISYIIFPTSNYCQVYPTHVSPSRATSRQLKDIFGRRRELRE